MTDYQQELREAEEQIAHYKRIASLRKRSLEAALIRTQVLEQVILDLGGVPPVWDPIADESNTGGNVPGGE